MPFGKESCLNFLKVFKPPLAIAFSFCLQAYGVVAQVRNSGASSPTSSGVTEPLDPIGWYTPAQAASGAKRYQKICASCHGAKLQGGIAFMAPALVGKQFWLAYGGKQLSTLWSSVHTEMPMMAPGSVSAKNSIDIMAFLLQKNGVPSGTVPLDDTVDLSKVLPSK
jgi:mono/diheme cytochrome c family protein